MIPGYLYTAHELTGHTRFTDSVFNPYDSDILMNQIHNGHTTDDNDVNDDDLLTDLITEQLNNCKYTMPSKVMQSKPNELKVKSWNIRSIFKNIDYLRENIDHFEKFDIICFNETNCDPDLLPNGINDITLDGFHMPSYKKPSRVSNRGGGLITYVNKRVCDEDDIKTLEFSNIITSESAPELEYLIIQIKVKLANNRHVNYIVGNFYRSPSANPTQSMTVLTEVLTALDRHRHKNISLTGDFNIDLMKFEHDTTCQQLIEVMSSHGFSQLISKPSRITDHSATLIDHFYSNQVHNVCGSGLITHDVSDHLATYVTIALYDKLNIRHQVAENSKSSEQMKYSEDNINKFKELLESVDWSDVEDEPDTQQKYDTFLIRYTKHYNTAFKTLVAAPRKHQRACPKVWMLPWLEEACFRKNKLYKKYVDEPTEQNKNSYDKMNAFVKKHVALAKKRYYSRYFMQHSSNSRKQWQMINKLLNRGKTKQSTMKLINEQGQTIKDPRSVSENFNHYFTSIAEHLKTGIRSDNTTTPTHHTTFLGPATTHSIFINPTDPTEVNKIICALKNKTTSDSKILALKTATTVTTFNSVLTNIINSSFVTGTFPSQMKIAKVVPIHKSGPKTEVSNYRPISLLSSFSKIFEKLMHKRVSNFLEEKQLLHDMQYGFRSGRSCEHALLAANNEILSALNKKQIALLLLIDFSKAFDMVDHDIMLSKLEHYGIRGIANNWFKSYLSDRKQFVNINGTYSSQLPLKYSVPQGSILGPLLFIIYINDIPNINKFAKFILYADDANIIITGYHTSEIISQFYDLSNALLNWVRANELALNIKKTNYMIFTRSRSPNLEAFNPKINNIPIERKTVARFLGVLVDEKLTWTNHIAALRLKMARYVGIIYKLKNVLPLTARLTIYNSLVQSHLNFCSLVWGTSCKSNIEKLFTTQKKAIRGVTPGYINYYYKEGRLPTHTKTFFTKHGILTVHNIILKNIMSFLNAIFYFPETLPQSIIQLIPSNSPSPTTPVENCSSWYSMYNSIPYNKTIFFKGPILFADVMSIANVDHNVPTYSKPVFKNWCKKYLLSIQREGDPNEWESNNFKLYSLIGIRRSDRIKAQSTL